MSLADVSRGQMQQTTQSHPIPKSPGALQILPAAVQLPMRSPATRIRDSHLNLDTFSPVNQNGSFEFDRVLKSGYVHKRTRKTKTWKQIYLVLRPNYLSIYKDSNENKLRHKICLADLTAVALLKDPKQRRQHLFGLFSPSRNYHLEAQSQKELCEWVDLIRKEARIEEEEEEMMLASPGTSEVTHDGFAFQRAGQRRLHDERVGSSSPEPLDTIPWMSQPSSLGTSNLRRTSHTIEYSGNELASHSDMSDAEAGPSNIPNLIKSRIQEESLAVKPPTERPMLQKNVSQVSGINIEDPERVIWQGHLLLLKSTGGVKQWKPIWVVLRVRNLSIYKDDSEYSPLRIISLLSIINAVEIDPLSKSKRHCLQVITEEKSYKFCARDEDTLDRSLGAIKSLIAKRKEAEMQRHAR
ncbi:hypothetical protein BJ878DRAFT_509489 [Calycina marina]|uniref:PH domain-containing protein n=1 Tax=Calycina marina TaxID=1763456 RepID=A0A9P7Z1I4_9HELO|nr:hypothetical protein BJ878DRAFT_509489 [Calycina marina]